MLAERRKLSATRISRLVAILALAMAGTVPAALRAETPAPAQAAYERGMAALKAQQLDVAVPALELASAEGVFLAQYYLARIFSDTSGAHADPAKAYVLFQRIADEYADVDPDDDQRAPFVAKSLTALAGYVRTGIGEIGLAPDADRAGEYLNHAATYFNDRDAQFELARLQLSDDEMPSDGKRAMHWLSVLTEEGHAGAQAFLADLYWRGKHVATDQPRALALVAVAAGNAPVREQIWIEDLYQDIFCAATEGTRRKAGTMLSGWRLKHVQPVADESDQLGLAPMPLRTVRTCSNGEPVMTAQQLAGRGLAASGAATMPATLQSNVLGVRTAAPLSSE